MRAFHFILIVLTANFSFNYQARGTAVQLRDNITPVLLIMGGYWSCGQNSQNLSEWSPLYYQTAAAPILGLTIRAADRLQKKFKRTIGIVMTCYSVDPARIHFTSNLSGKNTLIESSVDEMLQIIYQDLSRLENPVLAVIGHSYGGWTAMDFMRQLARFYPAPYLATIDPISRKNCTPDVIAQDAYYKNFKGECQTAPRDFDKWELDDILGKAQYNWYNYYQTSSRYLHSGPLSDSQNQIKNREVYYPDSPDTVGAHLRFLIDEALVNQIADDLADAF